MAFSTPREAVPTIETAHARIRSLWEPPPDITVTQWAEKNRVLPRGTTSRPGQFRAEKFQREMMDVFNDPQVREVAIMKSTQVGGTDGILLNIIGSVIDLDPKPIMLVMPSGTVVKEKGRKVIQPMFSSCPALRGKVQEGKGRDGGNTLTHKFFPGGFLKLANAGSGKDLRSDPIPVLLLDEVDGYDPLSEGDAVEIAKRRTDQYPDAKIFYISTPAKPKWKPDNPGGCSKIEELYEKSDKRRFHMPCPFCGHRQPLWWRDPETKEYRLVWDWDMVDADGRHLPGAMPVPGSARYLCASCGKGIKEQFKQQMLDAGEWVAEHPGREIVGFHINALYSPWKENWDSLAKEWVEAQGNPEAMRSFVNLRLGETYEDHGDGADAKTLRKRLDTIWQPHMPIPADVAVLTMHVDTQKDSLVANIVGHSANGWMRLIHHEVLWGDPNTDASLWNQLDELRLTEWQHASGKFLRPVIVFVDSGGKDGATDAVYDYVQPRQAQHVYAIKGVEFHARPVLVQRGTSRRATVELFTIATHPAKMALISRLSIRPPGQGEPFPKDWIFLPESVMTDELLAQLTCEKPVTVTDKRTRSRKIIWVRTHNRNEVQDLMVYAMAAIWTLQNILDPVTFRDLGALAAGICGEGPMPRRPGRRMRSQGIG